LEGILKHIEKETLIEIVQPFLSQGFRRIKTRFHVRCSNQTYFEVRALKALIMKELRTIGLFDEAERVEACYDH
jgi:hypothetical protein